MSNDFRRSSLEEKYLNDAVFYQVVNYLESLISRHGITPSELREALFLAHYKYEMNNPKSIADQSILKIIELHERNKIHDK